MKEIFADMLHTIAVNRDFYKQQLETVPHFIIKDIALVPAIQIKKDKSIWATYSCCMAFHLPTDWVMSTALENNRKLHPAKFGMLVLQEDGQAADEGKIQWLDLDDPTPVGKIQKDTLFMLTNEREELGAAYIGDFDTLRKVAKKLDSNFIIVPDTMHELFIISEKKGADSHQIKDLHQICVQGIVPEVRLSKDIFYFDRSTEGLHCIGDAGTAKKDHFKER